MKKSKAIPALWPGRGFIATKIASACRWSVALAWFAFLSMLCYPLSTCSAQVTAFTYQGSLQDGGAPANGTNYNLTFSLYNSPTDGNLLGTVSIPCVAVTNGLFTVTLDFGGAFDGTPRWLAITVQTNGGSPVALTPLQPILPAPQAVIAGSAASLLGTLPASQLTGTLPANQLPAAVITNNAAGLNLNGAFGGTFSGDGSSLTNILAGSIVYGNQVAVLNGVLVDAGGTYQTFITNASYTINGFTNLNTLQSVFSQTISNASGSPITISGPPGASYFGPASANAQTIPAGKEAIWSFWILNNVRTNICNVVQQ